MTVVDYVTALQLFEPNLHSGYWLTANHTSSQSMLGCQSSVYTERIDWHICCLLFYNLASLVMTDILYKITFILLTETETIERDYGNTKKNLPTLRSIVFGNSLLYLIQMWRLRVTAT